MKSLSLKNRWNPHNGMHKPQFRTFTFGKRKIYSIQNLSFKALPAGEIRSLSGRLAPGGEREAVNDWNCKPDQQVADRIRRLTQGAEVGGRV